MRILVIGSGGREHALTWKIKQSPQVSKIFCAPGNGGMASIATCVDIKADDIDGLVAFAEKEKIDLTVVGPEVPLVRGIADIFQDKGLMVFGPGREAARLEGSKIFAKEFMRRHDIPTADFEVFETMDGALAFIRQAALPVVIKADGLAAGKGVMICQTLQEAEQALQQIMGDKIFQEAGQRVVIEECLEGQEVSILALSDGKNFVILDSSQDHKRIFDDDIGPNTGGMGAYSPAPVINRMILKQIETRVIEPTVIGMLRDGIPFKGVLYAGLMITPRGPQVLEFNVRFGDPETQAVLPRLKNDLVDVLTAACQGTLDSVILDWDSRSCVCVVMSSGGYPGKYQKGFPIHGLDQIDAQDVVVFHAGTSRKGKELITAGGRVLGVTGLGPTIEAAIHATYDVVDRIKFDHCFFRRDIGAKALNKDAESTV